MQRQTGRQLLERWFALRRTLTSGTSLQQGWKEEDGQRNEVGGGSPHRMRRRKRMKSVRERIIVRQPRVMFTVHMYAKQ